MTVSLFAQHKVKDFETWKKFYDQGAPQVLKEAGVITDTVHRNLDDPNSVLVYHRFADASALEAFMSLLNSDQAREASKMSGTIMESISIWVGEDV